jgi:hypothetical protein
LEDRKNGERLGSRGKLEFTGSARHSEKEKADFRDKTGDVSTRKERRQV